MPVAKPDDIESTYRRFPVWPFSGIRSEWINKKDPNYQKEGSIFQGEESSIDPSGSGQIIGRPASITNLLRKTMQSENKLIAQAGKGKSFGKFGLNWEQENFFRNLLKGSWFHRRSTVPDKEVASTLAESRSNILRFGEPHGTSLTKNPRLQGFGDKLLRVRPVFEGDPLEKVVLHQFEPGTKLTNEAYESAVRRLAAESPVLQREAGYGMRGIRDKGSLQAAVPRRKFNDTLTEELENRGKRGILYSPSQRYAEYELKMFPGHREQGKGSAWVKLLDERNPYSKEIDKYEDLIGDRLRNKWILEAKAGKYHHLKEHYSEIDLAKIGREIDATLPIPKGKSQVAVPKTLGISTDIGWMTSNDWIKKQKTFEVSYASFPASTMEQLKKDISYFGAFAKGIAMDTKMADQSLKNIKAASGLSTPEVIANIKNDDVDLIIDKIHEKLIGAHKFGMHDPSKEVQSNIELAPNQVKLGDIAKPSILKQKDLSTSLMDYANYTYHNDTKPVPVQVAGNALKHIIQQTGLTEDIIVQELGKPGGIAHLVDYVSKKKEIKKSINKHQMMDAVVVYTQHHTGKGVYTENELLSALKTIKNATGLTLKEIKHLAELDAKETLFSYAFGNE